MFRRILILSIVVLTACNDHLSLDESLTEIAKLTPIELDGWEVIEEHNSKDFDSYVLMQFKKDTTHILSYFVEENVVDLHYHDIRFEDEEYKYYLTIDLDTLYFYKEDKVDSNQVFIQGKYEYLNRKAKLTPGQMIYYRNHRDSLRLIKGNSLPELPEN